MVPSKPSTSASAYKVIKDSSKRSNLVLEALIKRSTLSIVILKSLATEPAVTVKVVLRTAECVTSTTNIPAILVI